MYPSNLKKILSDAFDNSEDKVAVLKDIEMDYMVMNIGIGKVPRRETVCLKDIPTLIGEIFASEIENFDDQKLLSILGSIVKGVTRQLEAAEIDDVLPSGILGGEIAEENTKKRAYVASAYVLINQIAFYEILSRTNNNLFPVIEIEEINNFNDIQKYHEMALEVDYDSVFSMKILGHIPDSLLSLIINALTILRNYPSDFFTSGGLGTIFHTLIPIEIRKPMAAYYTLPETAKLLGELVVKSPDDTVVDPACGSGTLLVAAYQAKKRLFAGDFGNEAHSQFLENDILGVDFMPFAAHLAAMHLALQNPNFLSAMTKVAICDSMGLLDGKKLKLLKDQFGDVQMGQTTLAQFTGMELKSEKEDENGHILVKRSDIVIMNPPFSRFQNLSRFGNQKSYISSIKQYFDSQKKYISGNMSFSNYFLLKCEDLLKENGRVAAVLPATTLVGESTEKIRDYLLEKYHIDMIIVRGDRCNFSEDTELQEILLIMKIKPGGNQTPADKLTNFIIINDLHDADLSNAITSACNSTEISTHQSFKHIRHILPNTKNWFAPLSMSSFDIFGNIDAIIGSIPMTDIEEIHTKLVTKNLIRTQRNCHYG